MSSNSGEARGDTLAREDRTLEMLFEVKSKLGMKYSTAINKHINIYIIYMIHFLDVYLEKGTAAADARLIGAKGITPERESGYTRK